MWHRRNILPGRYAAVLLPAACYKVASAACDCSTLSRLYYDHPVSGSARPRSVTHVPYQDTGDVCEPVSAPPRPVTRLPVRVVCPGLYAPGCMPRVVCPGLCSGHMNARPHVAGIAVPSLSVGRALPCADPATPPCGLCPHPVRVVSGSRVLRPVRVTSMKSDPHRVLCKIRHPGTGDSHI